MSGEWSLYFHIPFCRRKCPYCHFFVLPNRESHHEVLLEALLIEWRALREKYSLEKKPLRSLYFGGGTPALWKSSCFQTLLKEILPSLSLASDFEMTVEANPEDLDEHFLKELLAVGVNRLSIGLQSFDDSLLRVLGRGHSGKDSIRWIQKAHDLGFTNISVDLMYEIPGQTFSQWRDSVEQVFKMPIDHISLYNLQIEAPSAFFRKASYWKKQQPSPQAGKEMLEYFLSYAEKEAWKRYELSAFTKKDSPSLHNMGYWTGRPYLGLGPSAESFWGGERRRNVSNFKRYVQALEKGEDPIDSRESLSQGASLREALILALRVSEGIVYSEWEQRISLDKDLLSSLDHLKEEGLLIQGERLRLSEKGLLFYDSVAVELVEISS